MKKYYSLFKGEVHPKIITSYLVVFMALSRMVKVRSACDKPFWIYKRLDNCAAPAPASDDVLVVASLACPAHENTSSSTTKTSSLASVGRHNCSIAYISKTAYRMHLGPSPFDSAPQTLQYMKLSFLGELPLKKNSFSCISHWYMYWSLWSQSLWWH